MNQTEFYKSLPRRESKYPYCREHPDVATNGEWDSFYEKHKDCNQKEMKDTIDAYFELNRGGHWVLTRTTDELKAYVDGLTASLATKDVEIARLRALLEEHTDWQPGRPIQLEKPSHGTCCTCQDCGFEYDSCTCEHNAIVSALEAVKETE